MRLLLLLSGAFTVSYVYSRALPDVANLDPTLLQGVTASPPNPCGGPTSQHSSSTTDQEELQTHGKRAEAELPDNYDNPGLDNICPVFTTPSKTKERKMNCPDGFFVYHLCCRGPPEETGGLYPNILNCRFSTSKISLIALVW